MSTFNTLKLGRDLQVSQHRTQEQQRQQSDYASENTIVSGEFLVDGLGQALIDVKFPVVYIEKPLMFFGSNLDDNQTAPIGSIPMANATVLRYAVEISGIDRRLYRGAQLAVTVTGSVGLKMWFHWHAVGMAMANPVYQQQGL